MRYRVYVRCEKNSVYFVSNFEALKHLIYGLVSIDPFVDNISIYDFIDEVYVDEEFVWNCCLDDKFNSEKELPF